MDGTELNLDGILQSVMQNPEMLKSAMERALGVDILFHND